MSHFSVLVIGENPEDQLAPYHEFECTGEDDQYVQEIDITEEAREQFQKDTFTRLQDTDGKLHEPYEDRFYRDPSPAELKKLVIPAGTGNMDGFSYASKDWGDGRGYRPKIHFIPNGWTKLEVQAYQVKTFAEYVEYYYGKKVVPFGQFPDKDGIHRYGYVLLDSDGNVSQVVSRTNPQAKWDWYQLGGRWSGFFKLKPSAEGKLGEESAVQPSERRPSYVDQLRFVDLDLEGMKADTRAKAEETFEKVMRVINGRELPPRWDEVRKKHGDGNIDNARNEYNSHPVVRDLDEARLNPWMEELHDYYCMFDKKIFVQEAENDTLVTFAVVINSEWHERGNMGWFGMVRDKESERAWSAEFQKLLAGLPPDTLLSLYDCHI